jgi:hypothetical protein
MTFAGSIWQWAVWSRRSRQAEVLVDDRRAVDPGYREPPPADRRDPRY